MEDPEDKVPVDLGVVEDPDLFDVGLSTTPPAEGLVILFRAPTPKALVFKGEAMTKLLLSVDVLVHEVLPSASLEAGEISGTTKKVTLH